MNDSALQQKRLLAAAIDIGVGLALAFALGLLWVVVGVAAATVGHGSYLARHLMAVVSSLAGLTYLLGRDILGGGRSLGKKLQDIRLVTTGGQAITAMESVKRNAIFALGSFLAVIASVVGLVPCLGAIAQCLLGPLTLLAGLASLAAAVVELIKIIQEPSGVRFGDEWAGTRVVH